MSFFKEQYFQAYVRNATNSPSGNVSTISQIPKDIPLETLIGLTIYDPKITQGVQTLQRQTQTSEAVRNAAALRLQQTGLFTSNLQNFRPSVSGRAIQRRRGDGQRIPLNPREAILRGLDPRTRKLIQDLEDLRALKALQDRLQQQTDRLEQQINKYTAIFNALINAPDAIISGGLTFLINKLTELEQFYNAAKAVYLLIKKAYENTKKAVIKALFKDIPKFRDRVKNALNILRRVLKLREIPRILKFPKFPKIPRINFTIGDFYSKYKLSLISLKIKNSLAYDKAYSTAIQQSGFEIFDPNKDAVQQSLRKARNSLRQARAQFQAKQAVRTAAVERARNQLINNVRHINRTVERERENILKQYQNAKNLGQQAQQAGGRKAYLSATEVTQLLQSSRVDTSIKNLYGDVPTGTITPDGRTVYTDRTNNKVYVLQSARDRITELRNKTETNLKNKVNSALTGITSTANTFNNLFTSYGTFVGGLNNNALKAQLLGDITQEVQTVNQIAQQAQQPSDPISLSSGTQQQEVEVTQRTKTITTVSRRLRPNDALNEAEVLNRQKAQEFGYSVALSTDGTPPIPKTFNGQTIYEARLTITYASQSIAGLVRTTPTTERIDSTFVPPTPVLGLPQSVIDAANRPLPKNLSVAERQEIGNLQRQIVEIDRELSETVNLDGTPISGEQRANLRAQRLQIEDRIRTIQTVTPVAASTLTLTPPVQVLPNIPYPGGVYRIGSQGNNVRLIQERLNNILFNPSPNLTVNGRFGNATYNAVVRFQEYWNSITVNNKLTVDGVVGNNTWSILFNLPVQRPSVTLPANVTERVTPDVPVTDLSQIRVPLAPAVLPADQVTQLGNVVSVRISRTNFETAVRQARILAEQRASQAGLSGTPRDETQYTETRDISGRTIYNFVTILTYPEQQGATTFEGQLAERQALVNALLQQGISINEINTRYSPPGPVDESGRVIDAATAQFIRTSTTPTRPRTTSPGSNVPPVTVVPGGDVLTERPKISVFELEVLNSRLESPDVSEQEKQRIRQFLGTGSEIPFDLQLPADPQLDFSQEATRPSLSVFTSANTVKLTYNAGRVASAEYSLDNGRTWTAILPPARAGDIVIDNLENGIYSARVRGIRADGSKTIPSQPQAIVIRISQPRIVRTEPSTSTSTFVFFDDNANPNDIKSYQFTTRGDNSGWTDALPVRGTGQALQSPIVVFGLEVDKTYTIRIRAAYKNGTFGNVSNSATFTTFKTRQEGGGLIA